MDTLRFVHPACGVKSIILKKLSHGISFIEVLVSLLLISLVLLGADAMQIVLLQKSRELYFRSIAQHQLQSMAGQLSVLIKQAELTKSIADWNRVNAMLLPQGVGSVSGQFPVYEIDLVWNGATQADCHLKEKQNITCLSNEILFVE